MRTIKKSKTKPPTILQQESSKLKQKLELLKQQVTLKKQQKQMNKTSSSIKSSTQSSNKLTKQILNPFSKTNTFNQSSKLNDNRLHNALVQMKIQSIQQKLKQKGIINIDLLTNLNDDQIDEWKEILVGYRIKLKKYIKSYKQQRLNQLTNQNTKTSKQLINSSMMKKKNTYGTNDNQQVNNYIQNNNKDKDIQDIIKERGKTKVYVPLNREIQQFNYEELQSEQITEADQDFMIQSFMNIFQPRRGILKQDSNKKPNSKSKQKRQVSWSKQVQKMQKQFLSKNHRKYPKQSIQKSLLNQQIVSQQQVSQRVMTDREVNQLKYCWKCFKKINIKQNIMFKVNQQLGAPKYFCGQNCQLTYQQQFDNFYIQLQSKDTEMANNNQDQFQNSLDQNYSNRLQQDYDLEEIDLSII